MDSEGADGSTRAGGERGLPPSSLYLAFFLSGSAALLFETLWFHLAGISLGNSVRAGAIVLSAYMAGLAAGSRLAARFGDRLTRPLRAYAGLELLIGVTGVALVLLLPRLGTPLAPLLRAVEGGTWLADAIRFGVAFGLMMIPTAAMGATLPIAVAPISRAGPGFGTALGRLYGWNTLGAVAGSLVGEAYLIGALGLFGTGLVAALMNLAAAFLAIALARRAGETSRRHEASPALPAPESSVPRYRTALLLGASFLSGAILLALEVVWLRLLLLFVQSTTLAFVLILAITLSGIGLGSLVAARFAMSSRDSHRFAAVVALSCGVALVATYALFDPSLPGDGDAWYTRAPEIALLATLLMLPVALGSGALFTLIGLGIYRHGPTEITSAGWLTAANTLGSMLGALAGGFLLLPGLGMERSFFLLAMGYAAVGGMALFGQAEPRRDTPRIGTAVAAGMLGLALVAFPFGASDRHLEEASARFTRAGYRPVLVREGLSETLQLLRFDRFGEPLVHRLLTDGFSMTGNGREASRYMSFYVFWPLALHPAPKRALLIGYGVGVTAEALVRSSELEEIHIVDRSRDVLEASPVVFEGRSDPQSDPRVKLSVEDGRHFLQTTRERYDLITAEPPPPAMRSVVNLYTREYFRLIESRLDEGGFVTYWLPVEQMTSETARSILAAFCGVFDDCALWEGSGRNWMMTGSRGAKGPVEESHFTRLWRDPALASSLREFAFERPELMGTTFLADADTLKDWIGDAPPVVDDRPKRISDVRAHREDLDLYGAWADVTERRARFERSPYIRALWPESLRQATVAYFPFQPLLNLDSVPPRSNPGLYRALDLVLDHSELQTPVYWLLRSDLREQRIVERKLGGKAPSKRFLYPLAARAMAERRYADAADLLRPIYEGGVQDIVHLLVYAQCRAGSPETARAHAETHAARTDARVAYRCW